MPVTLSQVRVNTTDDLKKSIIDEFTKNNYLLEHLPFDDVISPLGGGSTLSYGYHRKETEGTAEFRAINENYGTNYATKSRHVVDLKIFGGAGEIDRVINSLGGIVNELMFQMNDKIKAAKGLFNDTVINGDSANNSKQFDGLDVILSGGSMEFNKGSGDTPIDLSTTANTESNYKSFGDALDEFLQEFDGTPSCLMGNKKTINAIRRCAKRAGLYDQTMNNWGTYVSHYNGIPLVDLGEKPATTNPIVKTYGETVGGTAYTGLSDLYAVRFGMDAFHGIGMAPKSGSGVPGENLIHAYFPNFNDPGAVKRYEVEMIAAVVLKATKSAGVFRRIKVQ